MFDDPLQQAVLAFKQNRPSFVRQAEPQKLPTDTWKPYNTALEAAYIGSTLGDLITTRYGIQKMGAEEANPILNLLFGKKPSDLELALYGIGSSVGHSVVSKNIEEPYRSVFQALTLLLRGYGLHNNLKLGAKIAL